MDIHGQAVYRINRYSERVGQAYFNAAHQLDPQWADHWRGSIGADPFYDDKTLPAFLSLWHNDHKES